MLADMQVSLSEMQRDCSRCKIFASRAATPECRPAEFHRFGPRTLGSTRERDFRRECEDAPRESAILGENVRTLHARARFSARMRGRSTREHHFQRECEDAPRKNAISSENVRTFHARARFPARMRGRSTGERDFQRECEDAPRESAIFSENVRRLYARARFQARMRGRSTRERDFQPECEDAPRENAISNKNFCIAGRQPCTSDRRVYRSAYYFTILLFI